MSGADDLDGGLPRPPRWYGSHTDPPWPGPVSEPDDGEHEHTDPTAPQNAHTTPSAWQQAYDEARQDREDEQQGHVPDPREAAREVGSAWFGRDLIEPGPGWPFGRKARARRERRQQARQRTKDRRAALRQGLDPDRESAPMPSRWQPVDPAANAKAIASLTGVVAVVLGAAWWFSSDEPPQHPAAPPVAPAPSPPSPPPAPVPEQGPGTRLPKLDPVPPGGVAPIVPPAPSPADPAAVPLAPTPTGPPSAEELSTPESAGTAWFARWCGFDYRQPYGASEQAARTAMTAMGWDSIDPAGNERGQRSWDETVAAQEVGRCSAATAQISPEAPRSPDSAIVALSGQRVVTAENAPPYVEPVDETRIVKRETDGAWRIDMATRGG